MFDCVSRKGLVEPFLDRAVRLERSLVEQLVRTGEVLDYKEFERPSVVRFCRPGQVPLIVKLWYRKPRKYSSDRFFPHNLRFKKNADELRARGVTAPLVLGWGRVEPGHIRFASYEQLPGEPLKLDLQALDLVATARYVLELHQAGIDFRGLHLGNILRDEACGYSLIDVGACRFSSGPLTLKQRAKSLGRFCRHGPERDFFAAGRWCSFVMAYCEAMKLSPLASEGLRTAVRAQLGR